MERIIVSELEEIKKNTDFMLNNKELLEKKDIEKYLKNLEKIRYDIFNKIKLNNKINEDKKVDYINNLYTITTTKV